MTNDFLDLLWGRRAYSMDSAAMKNITNGDIFRSYDLHERVSPHDQRRRYRDTVLYLTSLIYWMDWE